MSKNKTLSTEETILAAAEKIFMEKGYTGTRMQEVADAANINKAMLHYYFRSKEKLFRVILTKAMNVIAPIVITCLSSDKDVLGKLEEMVTKHLAVLLERPHLPMFVMHELSQNQGAFITEVIAAKEAQPLMMRFFQQVIEEGEAGKIRKVDPIHLLLNTMSMTVFPFIARPMLATITGLQGDPFRPVLEQRREEILKFLRIALAP
ncbi:MAG: TetR/AcrR family transcriptional regulator [Bacteroidota bacterium]